MKYMCMCTRTHVSLTCVCTYVLARVRSLAPGTRSLGVETVPVGTTLRCGLQLDPDDTSMSHFYEGRATRARFLLSCPLDAQFMKVVFK